LKVARDDRGALVGLLPLMRTERPAIGPARARAVSFLGADPYLTELRAPIVDPGREAEVARVFAADLLDDRGWDWMAWEGLDRDSAFAHEIESAMPLAWGPPETVNVLALAPTWDAFRQGLKRNIKESIRRCYNSLKREGLTARLVVAESAADIDRDLGTFLRLHALRASATSGVGHPDRFQTGQSRRFLRAVCARLAESGVARVFTLWVGDVAVASRVGFQMPECLYLYYSGFEPEWSRYSVATTVVAESLQYAIAAGLPRAHLSMGSDVSKTRWGPEISLRHPAVSVRPRISSRVARGLYAWGRSSAGLERAVGRLLPKRRFD
jgi:CelD/BcsL family acetyltransferase involved in cellulose biosynthesis